MQRLTLALLAAAALVLAGMQCTRPPVLENRTGARLQVEVVYDDGQVFSGEVEGVVWLGSQGIERRVERLEIRRADGTLQRFDQARLDLLAAELPKGEDVAWVIESDGVRAVPYDQWKPLERH